MCSVFEGLDQPCAVDNKQEFLLRRVSMLLFNIIKERCGSSWDCTDFKDAFLGTERSVVAQTFQMKNIQADPEQVGVDFHYCPLLSAWQKLGFDDERCADLYDIAINRNRNIAEASSP